ncbi:hypothetical protein CONPUDRAFT_74086 [Coniophora puteana RWD-64-598 SS2]|uniref:AB hydrolase-1 domain-containing protein n=1 Tax=Coniophora puteana (strain RWD-64-598) TaxID=741705 RepID=A0A5M3ML98_CONPW|nr:uncharacterized protein CONPUDRAFT_74086 [Coniophora puteana RWD-64-598 SS2]EIW79730.1 hypothetical protein CONPUDRAFT_74086 [Coniophora puteana RWD-64-598 SS2]
MRNTIPIPETPHPWRTVSPRRTMAPLVPPPISTSDYPPLPLLGAPSSSFSPPPLPGYIVSTHVLPAAYPRTASSKWAPPPVNQTKTEQHARAESDLQRLITLKESQEHGTLSVPPRGEVLFNTVNCYRPTRQRSSSRPITLLLLHGIGLHKESWEPFLSDLSKSLECGSSIFIDEIWALELVQHGDAGLINERDLGDIFDSSDYGRDIANFLLSYLPDEPSRKPVGVNLSRVSEEEAAPQRSHLITVALPSVYPAVEMPKLFSSLILVESVSIPEYMPEALGNRRAEALCLKRQSQWNSWSNKYYRKWSPQAMGVYLKYALSATAHGTICLKAHPYQEAIIMVERRMPFETWELIASISPSVRLHWIMSANSVPQEAPTVLANLVADFLRHEYRQSSAMGPVAGTSAYAQWQASKL